MAILTSSRLTRAYTDLAFIPGLVKSMVGSWWVIACNVTPNDLKFANFQVLLQVEI